MKVNSSSDHRSWLKEKKKEKDEVWTGEKEEEYKPVRTQVRFQFQIKEQHRSKIQQAPRVSFKTVNQELR